MPFSRYNQGPYERCWKVLDHDDIRMVDLPPEGGDPNWYVAHKELLELHVEKSATYGTGQDPLANFTTIAAAANQEPERYVLERIVEKCARAIHMIDAGNAADVKEYPDIASLGLCAEALRRRRSAP